MTTSATTGAGVLHGSAFSYADAISAVTTELRRDKPKRPETFVWAQVCRCLPVSLVFDSSDGRCSKCGHELEQPAVEDVIASIAHVDGYEALELAIELKREELRAEGYFESDEFKARLEAEGVAYPAE